MAVVELRIHAAADPLGTPLVTLTDEDVSSFAMRKAENSLGSAEFTIRRDHASATAANLAEDNYVTVTIPAIDADPIFGFWLEHHDDTVLASNEEGAEVYVRQGPGSLAIVGRAAFLEQHYAPVPPASDDRGSANEVAGYWRWQHKQYGQIFVRLLEEGQSEPGVPLEFVTLDFDRDIDSDGVAWPPITRDVRFEIGTDGLTVMDRFAATGEAFITCTPGLLVQCRQSRGVNRTSSTFAAGKVRLAKGVNINTELVRSADTAMAATHALVNGMENTFLEVVSPDYSPGDPGKWVTIEYDNSNDAGVLGKVGLEALRRGVSELQDIALEIRAGNDELAGRYLPEVHFVPGDIVTLHTGTGLSDYNEVAERLRAYTITLREASDDQARGDLSGDEMAARSLIVGLELGGPAGAFGIDLEVVVPEKGCGGCPEPPPVTPVQGAPECAGSAYDATPAGTYSAPGSFAGGPDKVIYYTRPGFVFPVVPTYPFSGALNFGLLGPPDFAGDCVSNTIRLMFVGSGLATVHTSVYSGGTPPGARSIRVTHNSQTSGEIDGQDGTSGDSFTFIIDTDLDNDCIHWLDIKDGPGAICGGKWGFASVDWNATSGVYSPIPVAGQEIRDAFDGDGTTTAYTLPGGFAYTPSTLHVWVGGLDWTPSVHETDATTGAYTLDYAPPLGATVKVWADAA